MTGLRFALRLVRRITVVTVVGAFVAVVGLQYARMIGKNVSLAHQLSAAQSDIRQLQVTRAEQDRQIRRLSDPVGVIPEIHDKLHLVREHEALIYLSKNGDRP